MLQSIINGDLTVDPEILAELDEEQKQILFCKMREEQIRRYNKRESEERKKSKDAKNNGKKNKRNVQFLLGADNKEWVWVMGDHKNDKSIDEIINYETMEKAKKEAENELKKLETINENTVEVPKNNASSEIPTLQNEKPVENKKSMEKENIKRTKNPKTTTNDKEYERIKSKRSSEIYETIQEVRKRIEVEAKKSQQEIEKEWKKQEEKAKRLENNMRQVARRARQEWRRSVSMDMSQPDLAKVTFALLNKQKHATSIAEAPSKPAPALPDKPAVSQIKPRRPQSRAAIIKWYKETEWPKGAGFDNNANDIAAWFHGPITREMAEDILEEKPPGSFLVRVSERIYGYAISYRSEERCKHYLINSLDGKYEFFGTNQISHPSLNDLVNFHKKREISNTGKEILKYACGQCGEPPDYSELFDEAVGQVTKL